jgi:hypothetical protein
MMFKTWEQMSRREQLAAQHYDFYKEVHGIRPRWMDYDAMTEQELEAELTFLSKEADVELTRQREAEERAAREVEQMIETMLTLGAKSREMAIRWLHEAHDTLDDDDYLCYKLGLPYGYFSNTTEKVN